MYLISITRVQECYADDEGKILVYGQIDFKKNATAIFPTSIAKAAGLKALHAYVDYIVKSSEEKVKKLPDYQKKEYKETHPDDGCFSALESTLRMRT